jgi:polyisoprenoid-binding protein YceI
MRPLALLLLTCALPAAAQDVSDFVPAQTFALDPIHSSVTFDLSHLGFSNFTASFDTLSGSLTLDPTNPGAAQVSVQIPLAGMDLPGPATSGLFDTLMSAEFFDAATNPDITFTSDSITLTGDKTADIAGTLSIHGISQPVTLSATYNGGWGKQPFEPNARIGFSATTAISRTAFGMGFGVPAPGTTMGVGDMISVRIETEWTGPVME